MDTTFASSKTGKSDVRMEKLQEKFIRQIDLIKSKPIDETVFAAIIAGLQHFFRFMGKYYFGLTDVIIQWLDTILYVKKTCNNTEEQKNMFETKLARITTMFALIVDHPNADILFQRTFLNRWTTIIAGTSTEIRREIVKNDISSMTRICELSLTAGHFMTQLNALELFLKYIAPCEEDKEQILKEIIPLDEYKRIRELFSSFNYQSFDTESRKFLNEFNMKISVDEAVYSVAALNGFIGDIPIVKPMDRGTILDLWIDFNPATSTVSFFCQSATFPEKSSSNWVNIEAIIKSISVNKKKKELLVYSDKKIQIEPPAVFKMLSQEKLCFRFTCSKNDLKNLKPIIAAYTLDPNQENDPANKPETEISETSSVYMKKDALEHQTDTRSKQNQNIYKNLEDDTLTISERQLHYQEKSSTEQTQNVSGLTKGNPVRRHSKSSLAIASDISSIHNNGEKRSGDQNNYKNLEDDAATISGRQLHYHEKSSTEKIENNAGFTKNPAIRRHSNSSLSIASDISSIHNNEDKRRGHQNNYKNLEEDAANKSERQLHYHEKSSTEKTQNISGPTNSTPIRRHSKSSLAITSDISPIHENREERRGRSKTVEIPETSEHSENEEDTINNQLSSRNSFASQKKLNDTTIKKLFNVKATQTAKEIRKSPRNLKMISKTKEKLTKQTQNLSNDKASLIKADYESLKELTKSVEYGPQKRLNKSSSLQKIFNLNVNANCILKDQNQQQNCIPENSLSLSKTSNDLPKQGASQLKNIPSESKSLVTNTKAPKAMITKSKENVQTGASAMFSSCKLIKPLQVSAIAPKQQEPNATSANKKRKLYTHKEEEIISQMSADTQVQRRNYIQERRNRESRSSLKLVNLVKPLDMTDKSEQVKNNLNTNKPNVTITGGEEMQNIIEEYVNNRGYVGIKNALNNQRNSTELNPSQREIVNNNLEKINTILERTTPKFFKTKQDVQLPGKLEIYDVRNILTENSKVSNKSKGTKKPRLNKHEVPKYIGENKTATFSYRRNKNTKLGYMEKETIVDMSDLDDTRRTVTKTKSAKKTLKKKPNSKKTVAATRQSLPRAKKPTNFQIDDSDQSGSENEENVSTKLMKKSSFSLTKEHKQVNKSLNEINIRNCEEESIISAKSFYSPDVLTEPYLGTHNMESSQQMGSYCIQQKITVEVHSSQRIESIKEKPEGSPNSIHHTKSILNKENERFESNGFALTQQSPNKKNRFMLNRFLQDIETRQHHRNDIESIKKKEDIEFSSYHKNIREDKSEISHTSKSSDLIPSCEDNLSQFGDDYVDLDSYNSDDDRENLQILSSEKSVLVENKSYTNKSKANEDDIYCTYSVNGCNDSEKASRKRKDDENDGREIVLYKRTKTDSTVNIGFTNPETQLIFSFKRATENLSEKILTDLKGKGTVDDLSNLVHNTIKCYYQPYLYHYNQSKKAVSKMEELQLQIKKQQENFAVEAQTGCKYIKKLLAALTKVKKSLVEKQDAINNTYDYVINTHNKEANTIMKQKWTEYIDNVTKAFIEGIGRHAKLDAN